MSKKDYLEIENMEWDKQYVDGMWDYLCQPDEGARYSIICGFLRRYVSGGKILDLGCGAGGLWDYLIDTEREQYTGIDFSDEAINLACKKSFKSFLVADIRDYIPGKKYDAIIFNEVLYYLPQALNTVKRYSKYLELGGILVVSMFSYPNIFDNEYKIVERTLKALEYEDSFLTLDKLVLINETRWKRKWYLVALRKKNSIPIKFSVEQAFFDEFRNYKVGPGEYCNIEGEEFFLRSKFGYHLYCMFFSVNNAKKTVIISHGDVNYIPYLKYINIFFQRGFNVLVYDMRGFGKSGGDATTFGYYEKDDLSSCIDWVMNRCGTDGVVGLFGDSIGAAVSLQNMRIDDRVSFCISDCSFIDMPAWLKGSMGKKEHILPVWIRYFFKSMLYKIKTGISYKDISPFIAASEIKKPILFIHGKKDSIVPYEMSVRMYDIKKGIKQIKLFDNANHVTSYTQNKEEYDRTIGEFLNEIGIV
ncbi:alpha/beta fold hydrolase [Anaerocolumna xylanovorans]|uniref:Fermentation-respiration switch protein FrsA, has esterase activity, DUF1100 family n=1 Tax=Anaerocolumna xylanovorans DSM 12503 TaxID=1121345 RepID=A0A1M7XWI0_9FIRM|nr:alpha/beta fold hydrolase [Anaerocolumna xylanovorans]SHO43118.1 Fermentation-respiration switch protein FrsA, has esterase activity, DUF1100 family [Anaerocolumna xylanovorans DSM 12503]